MRDWDEVNKEFESLSEGYEDYGEYKVFFRPYVPSIQNDLLVAIWCAIKVTGGVDTCVACFCGVQTAVPYVKGEPIPGYEAVPTTRYSSKVDLKNAVVSSKATLIQYLEMNP